MKNRILLLMACFVSVAGSAQDRLSAGVALQYALPVSQFKSNSISDGSLRGVQLDILYQVSPKWRIGGAIGYQDFNQKYDRAIYQLEDGSQMGAVLSNSVQVTPILAKAMFTPLPENRLQPYFTLGAGGSLIQAGQYFGQFSNYEDVKFGFAAQGGLGVKYGLGEAKRTSIMAGATYNHIPFNQFEIGNLSHLGFQLGLRFTLKNDGGTNRSRDNDDNDRRYSPRSRYMGW
jgi:hypothetical protein